MARPTDSTPPRRARDHSAGPVYRSGAAARLAGMPVETLRVWERRYGVVGPALSARGQRRYTAAEVARLCRIKQLVDLGNAVSALAPLTDAALEAMQDTAATQAGAVSQVRPAFARPVRAALIGRSFATRAAAEIALETGLDIVGTCAEPVEATAAFAPLRAEVVVIELGAFPDGIEAVVDTACADAGAKAAVVLYRFGQSARVRALRKRGRVVARMPLDAAEIEALCRAALAALPASAAAPGAADQPRAPRFDDAMLAELARVPGAVWCECPRHLVDLLRMLGGFERYSAECESRSAGDAALHRDLGRTASEARGLLEQALVRVALAEGIALPGGAA